MEENKDMPVISISQMAEALRTQYRYHFILFLNVTLCLLLFARKFSDILINNNQ